MRPARFPLRGEEASSLSPWETDGKASLASLRETGVDFKGGHLECPWDTPRQTFPWTQNKEMEHKLTPKKLVCREAPTTCLASDRMDVIGVWSCNCYSHFRAISPSLLIYTEAGYITQEN